MREIEMYCIRRFVLALVVLVSALICAAPARAVILARTPWRNTWAPQGWLSNSGWQYTGNFGSFVGTPISSQHFITAGHIGGYVGQPFQYNGQTFYTTAMYDDPSSDLRVWKVNGTFWNYAPLYTGSSEVNQFAMTVGRGTNRGTDVWKNGQLKGWQWGWGDGAKSWGTNIASGIVWGGWDKGRSEECRVGKECRSRWSPYH